MSEPVGDAASRKEISGLKRMTQKGLRDICKKDKLYQTPRLNDVLYLHYQGYQYIECLEEYTELKCLWLECNAITEIEGLEKLSKLRCLFLQNNLIKRIDNLSFCQDLDTLNLSSNHIRKIENIGSDILPVLNTLNISSNYLKDIEGLADLVNCKNLAVLDLSNNRIDDILVVKIFEQMPCLKVLALQGNPVVSRLPQYRKTLILSCKELTYLDVRPVFPRDRACAEAWKKDGYEGERKENQRWNRADRKKMRDGVNNTIKLRNRHRPEGEQDALISSTDSEAEGEKDKRGERTQVKADLEYGCVDNIWAEVSGETNDDSSGPEETSDNSQPEDVAEPLGRGRRKPLEGRPKILHESQFPNGENNEKVEENQDKLESKDQELQRRKHVLIEEIKSDDVDLNRKVEMKELNQIDKQLESTEEEDKLEDKLKILEENPEVAQLAQLAEDDNKEKLESKDRKPPEGKRVLIEEIKFDDKDMERKEANIMYNQVEKDQEVQKGKRVLIEEIQFDNIDLERKIEFKEAKETDKLEDKLKILKKNQEVLYKEKLESKDQELQKGKRVLIEEIKFSDIDLDRKIEVKKTKETDKLEEKLKILKEKVEVLNDVDNREKLDGKDKKPTKGKRVLIEEIPFNDMDSERKEANIMKKQVEKDQELQEGKRVLIEEIQFDNIDLERKIEFKEAKETGTLEDKLKILKKNQEVLYKEKLESKDQELQKGKRVLIEEIKFSDIDLDRKNEVNEAKETDKLQDKLKILEGNQEVHNDFDNKKKLDFKDQNPPDLESKIEFKEAKETGKLEDKLKIIKENLEVLNDVDNRENLDGKDQELQKGKRMLIEEIQFDHIDLDRKIEVKETTQENNIEGTSLEEVNLTMTKEEVQQKELKAETTKISNNSTENVDRETELKQFPDLTTETELNLEQLPDLTARSEPDSGSELDEKTAADLTKSYEEFSALVYGNAGEPTPEQIKQQSIDRMYKSYASEIFVEQPEFSEEMYEEEISDWNIEQKMNDCKEPSVYPKKAECSPTKTKEQLDFEAECVEANELVERNIEELSSQLTEDLEELQQPLYQRHEELTETMKSTSSDEEREADKKKCIELTTVVRSLRISEEFSLRRERIKQDMKMQENKDENQQIPKTQIEEKTNVLACDKDAEAVDAALAKFIDDCADDVPRRVFGAGCDAPSYKWHQEECMRQLTVRQKQIHVDEDLYQVQPVNEKTSAQEASEICEQMSQKLADDEAGLRELLQQLEDEADVMYDITSTMGDDDDDNGELSRLPEPPITEVCTSILDELIGELQYQEVINSQNIKCFDFGLIESDEEYSYSATPNVEPLVPPELVNLVGGKTIRECLDSFGSFLGSVAERKEERKLQSKPTSSSEKLHAAKELLKGKNTKLKWEKAEKLDAHLAKMEKLAKKRASTIATRCYAKRENLEDSLEVIDNKLVIVKKDTGLVEDLPPPPDLLNISESESESDSDSSDGVAGYVTAEEGQATELDKERRNSRYSWPKAGQDELTSNAQLNQNELMADNSLGEPSIDQFYSLEARATFSALDEELKEKLDLQKALDSDGEITEESLRSMDELRANLKSKYPEIIEPNPLALVKQDEMLEGLLDRKRLHDERERQRLNANVEKAEEDQEPKGQSEREGHPTTLTQNVVDPVEEDGEQEEEETQDLVCDKDLGIAQLTLGSCKLYELKSELPEMKEEIVNREQKEEIDDQPREFGQKSSENGKVIEEPNEKHSAPTTVDKTPEGRTLQTENKWNTSIDDDIVSDDSTDYESGEDISVVEPPLLPEGVLDELFSNQFEDGLKLERENEQTLCKKFFKLPLDAWTAQEQIKSSCVTQEDEKLVNEEAIAAVTDVDEESSDLKADNNTTKISEKPIKQEAKDQSTDSDTDDGAIGELQRNAKRQWAKISEKLNEFINSDDMQLLENSQFNENDSNGEDDDELEASLRKLNEVYQQSKQTIELNKSRESTGNGSGDKINQSDNKLANKMHEIDLDNGSGDKIKPCDGKSHETNQENGNVEESKLAVEDINPAEELPQSTADDAQSTLRLDYFEALEPDNSETDFSKAAELKTDKIECNLEILNEDGDIVLQEVSVDAQVTYELK
ncbi:GH13316 [Drosophila grimshawi]|uniref:Dynein axonemal assembly factor 1 homolog n=1 Tax=Drosophila grimshawi TaxID=7222 RepID=B4JPX2_DROGR|nr:GH13316 [Drosophila grimshawi]